MDNETIIPGVGINGMTEKYDIKILICYLLYSIKTPLTKEQLNSIFQEERLINYFSFCEAFFELIQDGHLKEEPSSNGDMVYSLNQIGIETAQRLNRSLPKSVRDNVVTAAMHLIARMKIERENDVEIVPYQNGQMVNCVVHDVDFDLMRLSVFAPDDVQAERIKERFLNDPAKIYRAVLELLIEEN